ncbi:uncharacterized protein BYT42DRAFT_558976 [Radiomyces spectabilis]|uniref:uncharacterized protein n=1 Tax=Radiomyces spectabilis TaxID=64574 RepID=UPI00222102FD|nr:uncharacterized protein BYT42DRAFT_558976 [Radiomyces spectabilis]KAI8388108.1 hypothetical protein BYT42DRAFT_558976 [Radiomyces spectabilis]
MKPVHSLIFSCLIVLASVHITLAQIPACAAQAVFNLCLQNEDGYLKMCSNEDYNCLCKWHTAKLACWDNCPNDPARSAQDGLQQTFCAIAKAHNSTTSGQPSNPAPSITSSVLATISMTSAPGSSTSVSNIIHIHSLAAPLSMHSSLMAAILGVLLLILTTQ